MFDPIKNEWSTATSCNDSFYVGFRPCRPKSHSICFRNEACQEA